MNTHERKLILDLVTGLYPEADISLDDKLEQLTLRIPGTVSFKRAKLLANTLFHSDNIKVNFRELIRVYSTDAVSTTISADLKWYPLFQEIYDTFAELELDVKEVEIDENRLSFTYSGAKPLLNSDTLDYIQDIVNPRQRDKNPEFQDITNHDSLRVIGMKGIYTLYIHL